MKSFVRVAIVSAALALWPAVSSAQLIGNGFVYDSFPFGNPAACCSGTVYQQVYKSSLFTGGNLQSIKFFLYPVFGPSQLVSATFDLYVSTTTAAVNGLSTSNFDANRGANNTLFGTYALSGNAPSVLTFTGAAFTYDPMQGNLLLDFRLSNVGALQSNSAYFKADNGTAAGAFSRATNFGFGFDNWGLQTQFAFSQTTTVPEPTTFALVAAGIGLMAGYNRRKRTS